MTGKGKRRFWTVIFVGYLAVLLRITVFRSSLDLAYLFQRGTLNLSLFTEYVPLLRQGRWLRFIYLFVGNLVWFVPWGAFLYGLWGIRGAGQILWRGFLLSLMIEVLQFVLGTGVSELDDLILNTLGTGIGAAGYGWWGTLKGRRRGLK